MKICRKKLNFIKTIKVNVTAKNRRNTCHHLRINTYFIWIFFFEKLKHKEMRYAYLGEIMALIEEEPYICGCYKKGKKRFLYHDIWENGEPTE